jgi:hypothetical protein
MIPQKRVFQSDNLRNLLEIVKEEIKNDINCHLIGQIQSFNSVSQTAEIQIMYKRVMNGKLKDYPILVDCPIFTLSGGNGLITMPITKGDSCLVLFNDRDIDRWFQSGQINPPQTARKHSFSDGLAIVGFRNSLNKISNYLSDGINIEYNGNKIVLQSDKISLSVGSSKIEITASGISITGILTNNGKIVGDTHIHSGVTTGGGVTGAVV